MADRLAALTQQEAKVMAQIKATQNDKSLDAKGREAKVTQLTAQKTLLDAQLQRLKSQQSGTSTASAATAAPDSGVHVVA